MTAPAVRLDAVRFDYDDMAMAFDATFPAGALTAVMTGTAYRTSADLARVKGPFNGYRKNETAMLRVIGKHRAAVDEIDPRPLPAELMEAARTCWDDGWKRRNISGKLTRHLFGSGSQGSWSSARTQASSHGAGQTAPVNSGKLFVACRRSMASRQWSRSTRSFHSGIRLPRGQPVWQNGTPQPMQRRACSRTWPASAVSCTKA